MAKRPAPKPDERPVADASDVRESRVSERARVATEAALPYQALSAGAPSGGRATETSETVTKSFVYRLAFSLAGAAILAIAGMGALFWNETKAATGSAHNAQLELAALSAETGASEKASRERDDALARRIDRLEDRFNEKFGIDADASDDSGTASVRASNHAARLAKFCGARCPVDTSTCYLNCAPRFDSCTDQHGYYSANFYKCLAVDFGPVAPGHKLYEPLSDDEWKSPHWKTGGVPANEPDAGSP